jgi:cytochrome c-type biogenesis protein CcmH/NrfG
MVPPGIASSGLVMRAHSTSSISALNLVTGAAGILFGVTVGYIIGTGQGQTTGLPPTAVTAAAPAAPSTTPVVDEGELQAYRNILASDPKNVKAIVQLANKLYDGGRYAEAIPYYQQALALNPKDVSVSTDLGTAMYYAGRADEALAQLDKSLALDPVHAQTLFNIGIIRRDAKKDSKGAREAWERLLKAAPNYPDAARVRTMLGEMN